MNDEQMTPHDVLFDRLATRIGRLEAQCEWLQVQLEAALAEAEVLRPSTNGEMTDELQHHQSSSQ